MTTATKNYEKEIKDAIYHLIFKIREKKAYFFIYLSRKFLKNEGGYDLYVMDRIKNYYIKSKAESIHNKLTISNDQAKIVAFLKENKYSPADLEIPEEKLAAIRSKVHALVENDEFSYPRGKYTEGQQKTYYSRALKNLVKNIPEVKDVLSPELQKIICSYYGSNFGVTSVLCWRNYHVPQEEQQKAMYSNDWHNDYIAPSELKLFINITDVTEADGPLHVISAPDTKRLFENKAFGGRFSANDKNVLEDSRHVIKHTGQAGSAIFCHASDCLHRADIPEAGHYRDMLEFQFHPAVEALDDNWELTALKYK